MDSCRTGIAISWIPSLLWMQLIAIAYIAISFILYLLVRDIRLPFSPAFIAFGLFIGLCGITHLVNYPGLTAGA